MSGRIFSARFIMWSVAASVLFGILGAVGGVNAQAPALPGMSSFPGLDPAAVQRRMQEEMARCQAGDVGPDVFDRASCKVLAGMASLSLGQRQAGMSQLQEAIDELEAGGDLLGQALVHFMVADATAQLGQFEGAKASSGRGLDVLERLRASTEPVPRGSLDFFARWSGVPDGMVDQMEMMLGMARSIFVDQLELQMRLRRVQHVLSNAGEEAELHLEKARQISSRLGGLFDAQVFDLHGQLREKQGRVNDARGLYRQAADAARRQGNGAYAGDIERRLERLAPPRQEDSPGAGEQGVGQGQSVTGEGPDSEGAEPATRDERKSPESAMTAECLEDVQEWPLGASRQKLEQELRLAESARDDDRSAHLLVLLADDALSAGDLPRAFDFLAEAASRFATAGDDSSRLSIRLRRALLAHQLGRLQIAERDLRLVIALAEGEPASRRGCDAPSDWMRRLLLDIGRFDENTLEDGDSITAQQALARLFLGQFLQETGRPDEAIDLLERVLEASPDLGNQLDARAYYLLGSIALERQDHRAASSYFDLAESALGDEECAKTGVAFPETCFELFTEAARLAALEGDRTAALALSVRAEEAARELGNPVQELFVLAKRCSLFARSETKEQVAIWKQGEQILAQLSESPQQFVGMVHVATMAMCAGLTERALALTLQAEERLPEHAPAEFAHLLKMMRSAQQFGSGDDERAKASIRETLDLPTSVRMAEMRKIIEALDVAVHSERGPDAQADLEDLIASLPKNDPMYIQIQETLGQLGPDATVEEALVAFEHLVAGYPGETGEAFRQISSALQELRSTGRTSKLVGPMGQLASDCLLRGSAASQQLAAFYRDALLATPKLDTALMLAGQRLLAGERCLQGARLDESFLRHAEQSRLDFEVLATLQARKGLYADAFATAERARAFSLMRWLGRSGPDLRATADAELYGELEASKTAVRNLQAELDEADPQPAESLRARLEEQRERQDDLLLRLKLTAPEYSELAANQVADLRRVQQGLAADAVLVSYFTMADQTLAWVIERDAWRHVALPVQREELGSKVREMRRWLELDRGRWAETRERGVALIPGEHAIRGRESAIELYRDLIQPLDLDRSRKRLLLVPHDALQRLPFAALQDPSSKAYLAEHFSLSILPSASAVIIWQDQGGPGEVSGEDYLVLGDPRNDFASLEPLPHARTEARGIAGLLGVNPMVEEEARESVVRARAPELSLLAIAAHGVQNSEDPRRSFLALAADSSEDSGSGTHDGRLEMGEIFDELRFTNQPLVVLSACETGLGRRAGGDEIEGFIRAFLFAGAGAVAATLWPIDDRASSELMQSFFESLQAGKSAAEALQQAQLHMLKDPRFAAPYYWAGFSVTGNPRIGLRQLVVETAETRPGAEESMRSGSRY